MIVATPTLTVGGADLTAGPDLLAVDELAVTWGRSGVLEAPAPANAKVTVLDRSGGARFAGRDDLVGLPLVCGWSSGDAAGACFRGRISDVDVTRHPGGGYLAEVTAVSRQTDAGSYTAPPGSTWPAETFAARLARIVALLPPGLFAGGAVLPTMDGANAGPEVSRDLGDFDGYPAAAADVSGRTPLELLAELWASAYPVPLVYDPAADGFTYAPRHRVAAAPAVELFPDPAAGGRYRIRPHTGWALDAGQLAYSGALSSTLESRLTRVEVAYLDTVGQDAVATAATPDAAAESTIGRRTLSVASIIGGSERVGARAQALADSYAAVAGAEGRARTWGPIGLSTARTPFESATQAAALLAGRETGAVLYATGSWLAGVGARPLVGIVGGVIGYRAGDWQVDLIPVPVAVDPSITALTIGAAGPAPLDQFDDSVTFGDLAFVDAITN